MRYFVIEGKSKEECWKKARKQYGDCICEIKTEKKGFWNNKRYFLHVSITDEDLKAFMSKQTQTLNQIKAMQAMQEIEKKQNILAENRQKSTFKQESLGQIRMPNPNDMILEKLNNLERTLKSGNIQREPQIHPNIQYIKEILKENEFFDDFINEVVSAINKEISLDEVEDRFAVENFVYNYIKGKLTFTSVDRPNENSKSISVIIGPTGVGKSTTIAKIAGNIIKQYKAMVKIHIITIDRYKLGGVAQMEKYAELLNHSSFDEVTKNENLQKVLATSDADYILIDTIGRSQTDEQNIIEMKNLLATKFKTKYFLAISATTKAKEVSRIFECFKHHFRDIAGIIITKKDESSSIGAIINETINNKLSIAYITDGQKVPTNLKKADGDLIMSCVEGLKTALPDEIML